MNNKYYVYQHTRLDTNEIFYIGIGTKNINEITFNSIYYRAFNKASRSKIWKRIYNKSKNIKVDIIYESDCYESIFNKEKDLIRLHGRRDLGTGSLCNLTDGGEGRYNYKLSEESILKMRKSRTKLKNIKCINTGKIYETIRDLCQDMFNADYIQAIAKCLDENSKLHTYKGYRFTLDLENNSIKKSSFYRKVLCVDTGVIYNSVAECAEKMFGNKKYQNALSLNIRKDKLYRKIKFKYINN
jgi:hypothetical protein